ncbi:hypothetical protein VFPPC_18304 [Pochonia chlamydosporia 170]|uniref:Uncharacterized protein n=1 Tax=Pochonia chlamydosporia 170 TaxID=1380566 RepID=A0A179EWL2_METCM|nr:hypothetical protein VFPPC_18304 [Pochonia chlamydosporia 170]XP_022283870.1 hypothetical protein VFPPC_12299 [Pochonia chlamydosporia 170]OAQ57309.1 hypothetical protein VFPPC_12299 [Pochonia chlamydosporia 170]OWT42565.1 hypothetical protein VFPPC_18304 [Pochonia chlamydosporia 170]
MYVHMGSPLTTGNQCALAKLAMAVTDDKTIVVGLSLVAYIVRLSIARGMPPLIWLAETSHDLKWVAVQNLGIVQLRESPSSVHAGRDGNKAMPTKFLLVMIEVATWES